MPSTASPSVALAPATDRLVSVIVRSYNRLPALVELLGELLAQRLPAGVAMEIVVVEQSTNAAPAAAAALAALAAADPRVRVLRFPPLGGPRARNQGVRAARGELLLFMDDDDLPAGPGWLAAHLANYDDPACLGVSGRHIVVGGDPRAPYRDMRKARRQVLSYVPLLMWSRCWPRSDRRRRCELWMGGNSSLRRSTVERFGLWDEDTPIEDELSFCYRLRVGRRPGEYLVFDPEATMLRRMDIPGGMDKRRAGPWGYLRRVFLFLHHIVARYFPMRFVALYPAFVVLAYAVTLDWVWNELADRGGVGKRLGRSVLVALGLPFVWTTWLVAELTERAARGLAGRPRPGPALLAEGEHEH